MIKNDILQLNKISKGQKAIIAEVPEGKHRSQLIRLGILKGELIRCIERLPGGTIVIQKNRREIAIGMTLARSILVRQIDGKSGENKSDIKHKHGTV